MNELSKEITEMKNLSFINNYAAIGSTYIYLNKKLYVINNSIFFKNNTSKYFGKKGISYPRKLRLRYSNNYYSSNEIIINVQTGGILPNNTLNFELIDENNELIQISHSFLTISIQKPSDINEINKKYSVKINNDDKEKQIAFNNISNSFLIPNLFIQGNIGKTAKLIFKSTAIKYTKNNSNKFFDDYQFNLGVNFRDCEMGFKLI